MMELVLFLFMPALVIAVRCLGFEQLRRGSHHDEGF